jgi:alkylhydroperoxidase/carboxymuconolactone decarboxylase family protein YurZ
VETDELLRQLACNDEETVASAVGDGRVPAVSRKGICGLDAKTAALVRLAALLSVGAATVSYRAALDRAHEAGATDDEIVGVLMAVGPAVGSAQLVRVAPRLAVAIDADVVGVDDVWTESP